MSARITIHAETKTCCIIKDYLMAHNMADLCCFDDSSHADMLTISYDGQEKQYCSPPRLGEIIDQIYKYKNAPLSKSSSIDFKNGCSLDVDMGLFTSKTGEQISLTEKEVEILSFLNDSQDGVLSREGLLHSVWNYAKNVETHTLETHIYRLRQKIEENPASPEILITQENGYSVST